MSALQILEHAVAIDHHARAREMAKVLCRTVSDLLTAGESPDTIYDALDNLYNRYRGEGNSLERDAVAEVLDWFEDEGLCQSA